MSITHFRQLDVWRLSMQMVRDVYSLIESFPDQQKYILTSQIQRSAISIPSNIAESNARASRKDHARVVPNALGSCAELHTQVLLARDLDFVSRDDFTGVMQSCERVGQMLQRLHQVLLRSQTSSPESRQ
ncbi:MAG: four helix bundle protein [Pseudomonadota bacterium]